MPAPTISTAPPAPLRSDSPATFTSRAEAFVEWMAGSPDEFNALAAYLVGITGSSGPITSTALTMATSRILGRVTASTGAIEELTAAQVKTLLALTASDVGAAATSQTAEQISGFIASPSNKSYTIALDMKHAGTITQVTTKSASGTCTATWKINSTALGGTANSVSSTETSQSHSSSNAFAAGDDIVLTVSSNSTCVDMSFTIKYTRTLS